MFCITLAIWWISEDRHRCKNFPPRAPRLPILGNILNITSQLKIPALAMAKLAKIYGDVMYVKMGMNEAVVFSSHEAAKEIFNCDQANDRVVAGFVRDRNLNQNMAINWGNGEVWQVLRRFTIRTLRNFGFGKTASMDVVINEELIKFLEHFDEILKRSQNNNENLVITTQLNEFVRISKTGEDISTSFPFLRDWFPEWTGRNRQSKCIQKLCGFFREVVNEHRSSDSYATDPQSFLDAFLAKIDETPSDSMFNDEQLVYTMLDLFQAGADTSSNSLTFALLYLTLYPEKQAKVHEELDAVLSKDDLITAEMKSKLPYCTATLLETLRFCSIAPFVANREAVEDFKLRNYTIKKGTAIMINLQAMHYDEAVWGDPHVFRPERFLTENGRVDKAKAELMVSFGGGRRVCLGQSLAETTMLMYFTTFFRHFKLQRLNADEEKIAPSAVPDLGIVYSPRPFEAKVIRRK
ncbi:unnamed protein product [Orchesella dallaii]|uniref:Methyl farnesoate epoxidase n=1 Tax=Orchesella dallaii TaxID=48710 RepID=A0ABP1QQI9_9HEXA